MINQVKALMAKEFTLEWRHLSVFSGILLYLVSTVFVAYLSFGGLIDTRTWNALFWVIMLFASLNAILKSFIQESDGRMLYYYVIVSPQALIVAKILYNAAFMMVLSLLGLAIYIAFMGNPVVQPGLFVVNMLLGVAGFSAVMSLIAAIVSRVKNNFTLMGILSFPLILPLLLVVMRVSADSLTTGSFMEQTGNLMVLALLTAVTFVLSVVLFPYIWKE